MFEVFLCHSLSDRDLARSIAARLERASEGQVCLQVCPSAAGRTVVDAWECGLSSRAILLLLSPTAVPPKLNREEWSALLEHLERDAGPPVASILVENCPYPKLLERRHFYHYRADPPARFAASDVGCWIRNLDGQAPSFVPAELPWLDGGDVELSLLWDVLVDGAGSVALHSSSSVIGLSCLAQKFARDTRSHFRDILWVDCTERSEAAIILELASQAGTLTEGPLEQVLHRLQSSLRQHRLLLVLDNLSGPYPFDGQADLGRTSVLVTTPSKPADLPGDVQCLESEVGDDSATQHLTEESDRKLLQATSVCRPHGFPISLAAAIAGIDESDARAACDRLVAGRWIDPLDSAGHWFRLATRRQAVTFDLEMLSRRHAEALHGALSAWWRRPEVCALLVAEIEPAFRWALHSDWDLATGVAQRAFAFLKSQGRVIEAADIYQRLAQAARDRQDSRIAHECEWELSWIQSEQGEIRPVAPVAEQLMFEFTLPPLAG